MSLIAAVPAQRGMMDFTAVDVSRFKLGDTLQDVSLGNVFTLALSTATVDHVAVETVLNRPELRWLLSPPGTPTFASANVTGDETLQGALIPLVGATAYSAFDQIKVIRAVNAATTGTTVVIQARVGYGVVFYAAYIIPTTQSGSHSTPLKFSLGTESSTYANLLATQTASTTPTVGVLQTFAPGATYQAIPANTNVYLNVTQADGGTLVTDVLVRFAYVLA